MSHSVTGKLHHPARQFQAGQYMGFGLSVGVKYFDKQQNQEFYTNYEAVVFAKDPKQLEFYQSALVAGAIIEINGDKQRVKQYPVTGGGMQVSIEILNAKIGYIAVPSGV